MPRGKPVWGSTAAEVLMPMTRPLSSTRGPPELPPAMDTSIWKASWVAQEGITWLLMMPRVIVTSSMLKVGKVWRLEEHAI